MSYAELKASNNICTVSVSILMNTCHFLPFPKKHICIFTCHFLEYFSSSTYIKLQFCSYSIVLNTGSVLLLTTVVASQPPLHSKIRYVFPSFRVLPRAGLILFFGVFYFYLISSLHSYVCLFVVETYNISVLLFSPMFRQCLNKCRFIYF